MVSAVVMSITFTIHCMQRQVKTLLNRAIFLMMHVILNIWIMQTLHSDFSESQWDPSIHNCQRVLVVQNEIPEAPCTRLMEECFRECLQITGMAMNKAWASNMRTTRMAFSNRQMNHFRTAEEESGINLIITKKWVIFSDFWQSYEIYYNWTNIQWEWTWLRLGQEKEWNGWSILLGMANSNWKTWKCNKF